MIDIIAHPLKLLLDHQIKTRMPAKENRSSTTMAAFTSPLPAQSHTKTPLLAERNLSLTTMAVYTPRRLLPKGRGMRNLRSSTNSDITNQKVVDRDYRVRQTLLHFDDNRTSYPLVCIHAQEMDEQIDRSIMGYRLSVMIER